ncbi:hypothetical protein [Pseudodonghicola flavimaris]|uniref:DUF2497 domain-containing protein n=1 Tax=Pseudodonghicola flavimaris TaxID=3050036 RepID=A0ABT7F5Y1_9RHOB|nr:hypothetical protein [Pseudodonghicola flavimaris]MDK3020016.1 hypothetical protein [Pseudodonghicola flavimaris]
MPKPVTNAQIEDVLSSIRRLVSEETRNEPRTVADPAPVTPAGASDLRSGGNSDAAPVAAADRLVLTPALRVDEAEAPLAEAVPQVLSAESLPGEELLLSHSHRFDPAAPAEEAGLAIVDPEAEAVTEAELAIWDLAEPTAEEDFASDGEAVALPDDMPVEDGDQPEAVAETLGAVLAAEIEGATAEDVPAVDPVDEVPATDTTADSDISAALRRVAALSGEARAESASEPAAEEEAPYIEPAFQSSRSEALSAKIAALEAAIGRTRDQWEPDGDSSDAYAGTKVETIAWRDDPAPPRGERTASPDTLDAVTETTPDEAPLMAEEDTILDEDSLRELVAEIVRQELQGALGERITRNVRKLVRREIHRVMAVQDLD